MIVESPQHLDHQGHATFQCQADASLLGIECTGNLQVTAQLMCRPAGVYEELAKFRHRSTATGLGDIREHGTRGPHELIAACKCTGTPKGLGHLGGVTGDLGGNLVYEETTRVRAKNHALG